MESSISDRGMYENRTEPFERPTSGKQLRVSRARKDEKEERERKRMLLVQCGKRARFVNIIHIHARYL